MTRVGVRELKQNASEVLARVKAGESVEVTERGRPIALLVPLPTGSALDRLVTEGRAVPASGSLADLAAPSPARRGEPSLSRILAGMREDER